MTAFLKSRSPEGIKDLEKSRTQDGKQKWITKYTRIGSVTAFLKSRSLDGINDLEKSRMQDGNKSR
jgi:hypothetical protein